MWRLLATAVTALFAAVVAGAQTPEGATYVRAFEGDPVGVRPQGFRFVEARDAAPSRWTVQKDGSDTVLLHAGDPSSDSGGLALALLTQAPLSELTLSVRVKLKGDHQAAGLVWRYQDPDNYYFVQLGLSNQSIGLYRMVRGNRVLVEEEDDLELDPSAWYTLRVRQGEERARVYLGGIRVFEARDRALRTSGAFGLWSSGDTTAQFDDLRIEQRTDRRQDARHE
jgi:hypothetical protein